MLLTESIFDSTEDAQVSSLEHDRDLELGENVSELGELHCIRSRRPDRRLAATDNAGGFLI
jgi:hypothetical protein